MFYASKDIAGINLFRLFMDQLGGFRHVQQYLQVGIPTMNHWLESEHVPRAAVLALFWETNYGRSQIFTDQVNEIRLLYARVRLLERQLERCSHIITGLRAMHAGTANEPLFEEVPEMGPFPEPRYGQPLRAQVNG